jgi:hypothetical protein
LWDICLASRGQLGTRLALGMAAGPEWAVQGRELGLEKRMDVCGQYLMCER